ncbi:MAG TPA: NAD(P)-binding domain-containing protein [Bacteriovoracaceae bacterium]|nr:NAD(P)-binding domain-containing protein [Bacteriovoracaceae bacterium]
MKISVLGLGWYGEPLAKELLNLGHGVSGSTTDQDKLDRLTDQNIQAVKLQYPAIPSQEMLNKDIIVLNIPPFEGQLEWFKTWPWSKNSWVIFISSTSVISKNSAALKPQEEWVRGTFLSWTILRFGGLLGNTRHPGKILSGRKGLNHPRWPVNLLHLDDAVGFTLRVIEMNLFGKVFNVVCDEHHTREEFYCDFAKRAGIAVPEFTPEDTSTGPRICNEDVKQHYAFKRPTLLGQDT